VPNNKNEEGVQMAKSIDQWLEAYGESHQNKQNKLIHWICVPVITWTVIAILWTVQFDSIPWLNLGLFFILGALVFYARLSITLTFGMAVFASLCVSLIVLHEAVMSVSLWKTALIMFVLAWVGQFIGHKIEGVKPSFFEDVQFLLIGPAWLLSFIYRKWGVTI
jgi:uncharacterized membrane protein YGL010W